MGADEKQLEDILRIKRRRLNELEKQIARLGYSAPPELVNERDDLRAEVNKDTKALEPVIKGELSEEALSALRIYGMPASIQNTLQSFEERIYDLRRQLSAYQDQQSRIREKDNEVRETRQQETDRQREQVNIRLTRIETYIAIIGGMFLVIVIVYLVRG